MFPFQDISIYNVFLAIIGLVVLRILGLYINSYLSVQRSKANGPPVVPFIGCGVVFKRNSRELFNWALDIAQRYTSPVRIWVAFKLFYFITDPEQAREILSNPQCGDKGEVYDFISDWLGDGLLTAPVHKWKRQRRLIQPLFKEISKDFVDKIVMYSLELAKKLEAHLDGSEFDVMDYASHYTFQAASIEAFGITGTEEESKIVRSCVNKAMDIILTRGFRLWLYPSFIFKRTSLGKEQEQCIQVVHAIMEQLLEQKAKLDVDKLSTKPHGDKKTENNTFYELIRECDPNMSKKELWDNIKLFIITGYKGHATTITHALYLLANNPKCQQKAYEELYEIYGDSDPAEVPIKFEDTSRMDYLKRIVKEAMRLAAPIGLITRVADEDIPLGSYILPKGATAVISLFSMHRSETYWPHALEFEPDRFLPGHPWACKNPRWFIVFGAGPRNCIATRHSPLTVTSFLASLLRKYVFKTYRPQHISELKFTGDIVVKACEPIKLYIEKRSIVTPA